MSSLSSSQIMLNPDMPEAHQLRGWYDNVGTSASYSEYKRGDGDGNGVATGPFAQLSSLARGGLWPHSLEKISAVGLLKNRMLL